MLTFSSRKGEYPISWQNRFYRFARRLPVPPIASYFGLFVLFVFINHLSAWIDGSLSWWQFDIRQLSFHIWFLVVFIAGDYFLSLAKTTLEKFRPSLNVSDKEYRKLTYRFINLSSVSGFIITLLAMLLIPFTIQFSEPYQRQGISLYVIAASGWFMFGLVFAFIYFLIRSLRLIAQMYAKVTKVNIFHLDSLISFSAYTARVGIFGIIASALSYTTNVVIAEQPLVAGFLFFASMNIIVAILAFIFPILGIHERLQIEKENAKAENNSRLDLAQKRLHRLVDRNGKGIMETKNAISGLLEIRHELDRISTWPWNTSTLTTFISALFLPLVIWLMQQLLSRLL